MPSVCDITTVRGLVEVHPPADVGPPPRTQLYSSVGVGHSTQHSRPFYSAMLVDIEGPPLDFPSEALPENVINQAYGDGGAIGETKGRGRLPVSAENLICELAALAAR